MLNLKNVHCPLPIDQRPNSSPLVCWQPDFSLGVTQTSVQFWKYGAGTVGKKVVVLLSREEGETRKICFSSCGCHGCPCFVPFPFRLRSLSSTPAEFREKTRLSAVYWLLINSSSARRVVALIIIIIITIIVINIIYTLQKTLYKKE